MMEFLAYDLKVAILIAVFYMFYRLLLSRETFHRVNRVVLLATAVASFVLPLCVITFHQTVMVEYTEASEVEMAPLTMTMEVAEPQTPLWQTMVIIAFFIGMTATLAYTIQSVVRVWSLIRHSKQYQQADGTVICVVKGDVSPFSWMRYIVLSQSDYETNDASILAHERGHIRRRHSMDLLLVDTLTALQWFNPAMWMLRQDLRAIHEYEADAAVLSQGINMRQYQYLLIQKAVSHCGYSVANGISHSTLKNRINMMLHKNSSRTSLLKLFVMAPIVGVTLALNAETVNDYVYEEKPQTPQKPLVKKGKKDATVKKESKSVSYPGFVIKADKAADNNAEKAAEKKAEPAKTKPFALHAVVDQYGRITGFSSEGEPDPRQPMEFTIGNIFFGDREATLEEVKNYKALGYDMYEMVYNPNTDAAPKLIFKKNEQAAAGATEQKEREIVFDVVEHMPEFPGGAEGMMKFLTSTVKYPAVSQKNGVQGRVVVKFVVEKDGSVSSARVVKSVNEELDAEALRVVNAMPAWTPGKQNGRIVRVYYTIPIVFRLQ